MKIGLPDATIEALQETARRERRDLRAQVEHLLIHLMYRRGLVSCDGQERRKRLYPDESVTTVEQRAESAPPSARRLDSSWN